MLIPNFGKILIKEDETEETAAGGLITIVRPENDPDKKFVRGIVLTASKGFYAVTGELIPTLVKEGDKVWYNKYNVAEIHDGSKLYTMLDEKDVLLVEREDKE